MNFDEYRQKFYKRQPSEQDWAIEGQRGFSIHVSDYAEALAFYTQVLGNPHYIEGQDIHGWRLGDSWFTLFQSQSGGPTRSEISLHLQSNVEVDRLTRAFVEAGASGEPPAETLMYAPVYVAFLTDPFGLSWSLVHTLPID